MTNFKIKYIFIMLLFTLSSCNITGSPNKDSTPSLLSQGTHLELAPERTKFVDKIGSALLYRGSLPINNGQFDFQATLDSMVTDSSKKTPVNTKTVAPETLPESFYFIDFNLLAINSTSEHTHLNIEEAFFKENPTLGKVIHHDVNALFLKGLTTGKTGQIIDTVIEDLHDRLTYLEEDQKPRIIYVHCEAGLDRTGAVIAGYAMRYLGYSYIDALAINHMLDLRDPNGFAKEAIKLYAKYLKDTIGINTIGKI